MARLQITASVTEQVLHGRVRNGLLADAVSPLAASSLEAS